MRESRTSGSVGGLGGQPPRPTRPGATGGCWTRWQGTDRSNHLKKGTHAAGGNILFLDGHTQWRQFDQMEHRWFWQSFGNPCLWW